MTTVFDVVADIGGTNARFACAAANSNELLHIKTLKGASYPRLDDAFRAYVEMIPKCEVETLCLAVAAPVEQDPIQLTNSPWIISRSELSAALRCEVIVINDFTAQASSLEVLKPEELEWWGTPRPPGNRVKVVLGPGTGLGVAGISPEGSVMPTEGGHIGFAPSNRHELQLLDILWNEFERVSVERLLSGPGLCTLYEANAKLSGARVEAPNAADITKRAQQGDALCLQTTTDFLDILATVAGDYVLGMGARDGVYLTGGILPQMGALLDRERFRKRFDAKGRMQQYCATTPLALIRAENTGLRGCLAALHKMHGV